MSILCRAYLQAGDPSEAQLGSEGLLERLRALAVGCSVEADPPQRYWKIPEYYELACAVEPPHETDEAGLEKRLADGLGTGWVWLPNGTTAVCSLDKGGVPAVAGVRWMELDLD